MNRRDLSRAFTLTSLFCLVAGSLRAQTQVASKSSDSPRPFRLVNVPEDSRRVLFFFDFACPYCAAYYEPLLNFTATVPKQIQVMFIPVVNMADIARRQEQLIAAKCYYAAFQIASKDQMARFGSVVYQAYAETHSLKSKDIWARAAKVAGLDVAKFAAAMKSGNNDFQIQLAARKTIQYALTATPSVAVGGKYVLTPEDVIGDQQMFFNILNGLTSEIL